MYVDRLGRKPILAAGAVGSKFMTTLVLDLSALFPDLSAVLETKYTDEFSQWL